MSREAWDRVNERAAERRRAIVAHHAEHGSAKTCRRYRISKQRLSQVLIAAGVRRRPKAEA
jgi:hypothetical protein